MGANSEISWCHHTWNLAWGCNPASPGCDNCYAEVLAKRWGYDVWGKGVPRRTMSEEYWKQPLKWDRIAARLGERHRTFCSSMTDVFLNDETIDRERLKLWSLIKQTPNLDWLLLTKHPERIKPNLPDDWGDGYPNVWLGVSVEAEPQAWRVEALRKVRARIKFLSCEPLLGPLPAATFDGVDWVIVGGESGPHARPMHPQWARNIRDACIERGVAFHLKQFGEFRPIEGEDGTVTFERMGKGRAGRDLDGEIWDEFPTPRVAA